MERGGEASLGSSAPLLEFSRPRGSAWGHTLVNIVVSVLGTGALGLPYAFRVAGWLAASLGLTLAALAVYYCMLLLVQCRKKVREEEEAHGSCQTQTYGDVGAKAFGATGRCMAELMILISHAGGAVSYLLFIGQNLSSILISFTSTKYSAMMPPSAFIFLLLPLQFALSFIRSLSFLAPFSVFATLCNVCAVAVVVREDIKRLVHDGSSGTRSAFNGVWSVPFALGVAVFCFEGLGMTLALESSMANQQRFPWVLLQAFIGLAVAYICFGAFGYLAYGDGTKEIVTLNLPANWTTVIVKVGLCIAIAFSFPITVHPIHEIMEMKLKSSGWFQKLSRKSQAREWLGSQVARVLVVAALAVLAASIPGFAILISFTGSTVCALIAFVLPTAFHLRLMGSSLTLWQKMADYLILFGGSVFAVYGIYTAISGCL